MGNKKTGQKGFKLEEMLRGYFLRAGFFVIRGVLYRMDGEDLTDIDLWLYERPTGTARRRQIVDAKSRTKPKTVERLLWTKGLSEALDMDGAYVATTDSRAAIRRIARKLGLSLFDGEDLRRIEASDKVRMPERLTDEELWGLVRAVDKERKGKEFQTRLHDAKASVVDKFGPSTIVRSLEAVSFFASSTVSAYPGSPTAKLAGRLSYLSASLVAVGLDAIGVDAAFRSAEERRTIFINAIRYGNTDSTEGLEKLRLATALVRQYAENGSAIAQTIEEKLSKDLNGIPAEIVADQVVRMGPNETLFTVARELEHASYLRACPPFDRLDTSAKSFLGALLDYCGIERAKFATAWRPDDREGYKSHDCDDATMTNAGPLFNKR
ncbi:MAG: hypothetical protein HY521_00405 [Proteobacteria bacterium]|nr:hypothetical protein [Pseudomonadota bacterium]